MLRDIAVVGAGDDGRAVSRGISAKDVFGM